MKGMNKVKIKRTSTFTKFILVVLLIYAVAQLVVLRGKREDVQDTKLHLEKQVADISAEIEEKQYALDHRGDDEVIEDIAREEGYVYQDEEVYYAG